MNSLLCPISWLSILETFGEWSKWSTYNLQERFMISVFSVTCFTATTLFHKFFSKHFQHFLRFVFFNFFWNVLSNHFTKHIYPVGIYMFKVNNRNTRTRYEICSKLTIKTPERCQWRRSGVFIVTFEHISHHVLMFLLLTLGR